MRQLHRTFRAPAVAAACLAAAVPAAAQVLDVRQLTNDAVNDLAPRISAGRVVWQAGTGDDAEIALWNGSTVVPITNDTSPDEAPDISGNVIVWQRFDGNDWEVMRKIGAAGALGLTFNTVDDTSPRASGSSVAWLGVAPPTTDTEVFLDAKQITGNGVDEGELQLEGVQVVWSGAGGNDLGPDTEIFLWDEDLDLFTQINASNVVPDGQPQLSDGRIVWVSGSGAAAEVWRFDPLALTTNLQITTDGFADSAPAIDGDLIVWESLQGADREIYLMVGDSLPIRLTDDDVDDHSPQVSDGNVVWVSEAGGDAEIMVCLDCASTLTAVPLTDDAEDDVEPRIDGMEITWRKCTGLGTPAESCDVMLAPEPATTALVAAVLLTLAALASRSARRAVAGARR